MRGTCKICGCTEKKACNHPDFGPCWWVDDDQDLCSHCCIDELKDDPAVESPEKRSEAKFTAKPTSSLADIIPDLIKTTQNFLDEAYAFYTNVDSGNVQKLGTIEFARKQIKAIEQFKAIDHPLMILSIRRLLTIILPHHGFEEHTKIQNGLNKLLDACRDMSNMSITEHKPKIQEITPKTYTQW